MFIDSLLHLIHSLSKAEKRQIKINSKKHDGDKDYLILFNLIEKENIVDKDSLVKKFSLGYPGLSLENTSRYLFNAILETLIHIRTKNNSLYELTHGLLRVQILNERNLNLEGYKEVIRLKSMARNLQHTIFEYLLLRLELNYHLDKNFENISEKELINMQIQARGFIKQILNTHEHFSLYELLKFRMAHTQLKFSIDQKKKLDDLLLNEMSVINARVKHNVESQKLHLLFQSYFFTNSGNYKAASSTFHELNLLFEKNKELLRNPPLDYFAALDGILDNLRTNYLFGEMGYYILKLQTIDKPVYPEYFHYLVKKTALSYSLAESLGTQRLNSAFQKIRETDPSIWKRYPLVDDEIQNELLFYTGLIYFLKNQYKSAQKYINAVILTGKINPRLVIYKAARLLNLMLSYEAKDYEFINYDIRSYKRLYQPRGWLLKTEKLFFKMFAYNPALNSDFKNRIKWKNFEPLLSEIEISPQEKQLSKYFNFTNWVREKFNGG